ncbi:MAG: hypothetical protein F4Z31_07740 [Gemmatimonadetes bacterium]|nr:hypothetical protein [Gemmatimonadota bacterium]MYJ09923.1 hypothetical protein [Gemmatimonadota bacterium]
MKPAAAVSEAEQILGIGSRDGGPSDAELLEASLGADARDVYRLFSELASAETGQVQITRQAVARALGWSWDRTKSALRELRRSEFVFVDRKNGRANRYTIPLADADGPTERLRLPDQDPDAPPEQLRLL